MKLNKKALSNVLAASALSVGMVAGAQAQTSAPVEGIDKAMVILTSSSLQTQGMAMVLSQAMQAQGTTLDILLCDQAGDLALKDFESEQALAPHGMKPEGLMQKVMAEGANVAVCALYLPNSGKDKADLRDGVQVAEPPVMAKMMRATDVRVFEF